MSQRSLTDQLAMKVNVANGNVLLTTSELSIKGTGISLGLGGTFNSEENYALLDDGNNWFFNTGRGVTVDLSNLSSGITLHGPSDYSAFFPASGGGNFSDAPGLNASIKSTGGGTYTVTFHKSGEQWGFNNYGARLTDCDKNGHCLQFTYGGNGDLTRITDSQNRTVTFTQGSDSSNNLHQVTSYSISTSDGISKTITHSYTGFNLTGITNADQKSTAFAYYSNDRIKTITDPLNHSTSYVYDSNGRIQTITDANNKTVQFAYYPVGNSACSAVSKTTQLACTVVTDQNGHATTYGYNTSLEVLATQNALGYVSSQTFDNTQYNVASATDALTNTSNFTYDVNNNLTSSKDATGAGSSYTYKAPNQTYYPDTSKDAQGNVTDYTYDTNGNTKTVTDDSTKKGLSYTYNSSGGPLNGTIATQTDADGNGHTTNYGYDSWGNLATVTPPAPMGKTTIVYDGLSRVAYEIDGNNHKTTFTYDAIDRIKTITYADSTINYTYDAAGNVLTEADHTGTTTFTYDPLNREQTKQAPGAPLITNGYDYVGNLTSLNDGTGTTTYVYNQVNDMTTLTAPGNAQTTYGYDKNNHKISIAYPNGTGELIGYDPAGRETSIIGGKTTGSGSGLQVTPATAVVNEVDNYGPTNGVKDVLQTVTALDPTNANYGHIYTYGYDSQNRLTNVNVQDSVSKATVQTWSQIFDANGNLTNKTYNGASNEISTYSTYNGDNQPSSASSTGNYAGQPVSGGATFSYDGVGNLTAITNSGSPHDALPLAQTHSYNAANQDVSGSGIASGSTQSYSGSDQTDRVTNNGATTVYTSLGLSTEQANGGTTEYVRCSCGMLNSERTPDGKAYYYLFDGHGSIVGMTDSSGNDVNRYNYDPFGGIAAESTQSGLYNPWQYSGGYYDAKTGLTKFGIRYFDPQFERWTQATPIGGSLQEALKANPYEYAGDDPVNEVDPSGAISVKGTVVYFNNEEVNAWLFAFAGSPIELAGALDAVATFFAGPVGTVIATILDVIGVASLLNFAYLLLQANAENKGVYIGIEWTPWPNYTQGLW